MEYFDGVRLQAIIENFDELKTEFRPEVSTDDNWDVLGKIKKYMDGSVKIDGDKYGREVKYYQSIKNTGRMFAVDGLSLQSLPREIRNTISEKYYIDIDTVNSAPTLLYQYCKTKNLKMKCLKKYVKKREEFINEYMKKTSLTREKIKNAIIIIVNGGSIIKELRNEDFIKNLKNEIEYIKQYIYKNETKYKKIVDKKDKPNKENSAIAYLLNDIENDILQCMINYLKNNKIMSNCVMVFDGFMMLKDDLNNIPGYDINKLLRELEEEVYNQTNYKIKLLNKPMEEYINIDKQKLDKARKNLNNINDPKYKLRDLEQKNKINIVFNDCDASNLLFENVKNLIIATSGLRGGLIMKMGNYYTDDKNEIEGELLKTLNNLNLHTLKEYTPKKNYFPTIFTRNGVDYVYEVKPYCPSYNNKMNIIKELFKIGNFISDEQFYKKVQTTTKNKMFFTDGYYDLIQNKFISWEESKEVIYCINYIKKHYTKVCIKNEELDEQLQSKILEPILGKYKDQYLKYINRCMFGCYEDKNYSLLIGERDSGKGVLQSLIETAFLSYVGMFNLNSLLLRDDSGDENKKLSWVYNLINKRFIYGNEIRVDGKDKNKPVIDGIILKSLCSGGDKIQLRQNFKDEVQYYTMMNINIFCNECPKIEPEDTYQKAFVINMPHKFVDNIEEWNLNENPHFRKADETLKTFVARDDVANSFINIILSYSKDCIKKILPNEDQMLYLENFKTDNNESTILNKYFNITKNINNYITLTQIKELLKYTPEIKLSLPKIGSLLINRGCILKRKIIDNKKINVYCGVIINNQNTDNTNNDLDI